MRCRRVVSRSPIRATWRRYHLPVAAEVASQVGRGLGQEGERRGRGLGACVAHHSLDVLANCAQKDSRRPRRQLLETEMNRTRWQTALLSKLANTPCNRAP